MRRVLVDHARGLRREKRGGGAAAITLDENVSAVASGMDVLDLDALRSVDPSVPLDDVASMEDRLYTAVAQPRQWATLLGTFAATALGLAAIGVFGMLSYMVGTRRREIGVRMALGAGRRTVVRMVVASGFMHALIGSALGLSVALFATRTLKTVLYEVSAADPATLSLATLTLLSVALVACWLPRGAPPQSTRSTLSGTSKSRRIPPGFAAVANRCAPTRVGSGSPSSDARTPQPSPAC